MNKKEILLQLKDITVSYGKFKALDKINIALDEGEIVAIIGPNGSGKSTILRSFFGLVPADTGQILWHERPIKPIPHQMVKRNVAYIPQGRRVFEHLTVAENLEVGGFMVKNKRVVDQRIERALDIFPALKTKMSAKAGTLSGGQQQMLALARGLMTNPQVLLLDEPSLGLSPKLVSTIFEKILEISEKSKIAVLVVEHNIMSLLRLADRVYALEKGKIVYAGPAKGLKKDQIIQRLLT